MRLLLLCLITLLAPAYTCFSADFYVSAHVNGMSFSYQQAPRLLVKVNDLRFYEEELKSALVKVFAVDPRKIETPIEMRGELMKMKNELDKINTDSEEGKLLSELILHKESKELEIFGISTQDVIKNTAILFQDLSDQIDSAVKMYNKVDRLTGAGIGYHCDSFKIELEINYIKLQEVLVNKNKQVVDVENITRLAAMVGAYYNLSAELPFTPYIGFGLGFTKENSYELAYQAKLGINYFFNSRVSVSIGYNYFNVDQIHGLGFGVNYSL